MENKLKTSVNLLAACFMLVSCLAYSLNLKMEAACSSEASVNCQWTTWHIPEDIAVNRI
jgi:hypothetical protein